MPSEENGEKISMRKSKPQNLIGWFWQTHMLQIILSTHIQTHCNIVAHFCVKNLPNIYTLYIHITRALVTPLGSSPKLFNKKDLKSLITASVVELTFAKEVIMALQAAALVPSAFSVPKEVC